MRAVEKIIAVLCCLICISACGNRSVTDEASANIATTEIPTTATAVQTTQASSESVTDDASADIATTEISTTATAVQTTQASSESVTVPVETTENMNETSDIEVPENAVYRQTVTRNGSHGFFEKIVNIFDKNDNRLISAVYTSENDEPPTSKTLFTYDADGRLIREEFYYNDRLLHYIEYEYDENGVMISDTNYHNLPNGEVHEIKTEYIYDDKGRLFAEQEYQNDHQSGKIEYEYDEQDRLIKDTFYGRINSYRSYLYDENGNLSEKTVAGENGVTVTYYTYDENNRLIKAEDYHEGEWIYTYEYEYEEL